MNIQELVSKAQEGIEYPLIAYIELKRLEKQIKDGLEALKEEAVKEAENYESKEFKLNGAKITVKNAAGIWDFSRVKQVTTAEATLKKYKQLAKDAAKASEENLVLQDENGEIIQPAFYVEGQTTIAVSISE